MPEDGKVYVSGDVPNPGPVTFDPASATILQILSQNGSVDRRKYVSIYRPYPDSVNEKVTPIAIRDLLEGRITDPSVAAGDLVYVSGRK